MTPVAPAPSAVVCEDGAEDTPKTAHLKWLEAHPELAFGGGAKIANSPGVKEEVSSSSTTVCPCQQEKIVCTEQSLVSCHAAGASQEEGGRAALRGLGEGPDCSH